MQQDHSSDPKSRWQDIVMALLALSVESSPLEERLRRAVDIILEVSWLPLKPQGGLFLFDKPSDSLKLVVSTGLSAPIQKACATVELGQCLCGKAAKSCCAMYAENVDEEHDIHYPGMSAHGHYIVPVMHGEELLGILTLYLAPGHVRNDEEIEAIEIFCRIIATMIVRARAVEKLEQARVEAEIAAQTKSQFLSNMSHEIRTPLTAIVGYSEALQQHLTLDEFKHCIKSLKGCSSHLLEIVNSVLDFAKIEAGKLELDYQSISFSTMVEELIRTYEQPAQQKGLQVKVELDSAIPDNIVTDLVRAKQILVNLISNAIKFTHSGSVTLTAEYLCDFDRIRISVKDTGIGMTPVEQQALFQVFCQAEASIAQRYGGTGLGLHIANELATKLGSAINVESDKGTGSTFTFELHCNSSMSPSVSSRTNQADSDVNLTEMQNFAGKVLIGEDGKEVRELLAFLLRHSKLQLEFACDGLQTLNMAQHNEYDLVIMDIQMPQMSGSDVMQKLRSQDYQGPVIALTANAYQHEVEFYLRSGFDHVLAKPFQAEQLYKLLSLYCSSESSEDDSLANSKIDLTMEEVISGFVSSLPQRLSNIRQCRNCNGLVGLRNEVHNLCAAGLFGFDEIEKAARDLQTKLDSGDSDIETVAQQLENLLEKNYGEDL